MKRRLEREGLDMVNKGGKMRGLDEAEEDVKR